MRFAAGVWVSAALGLLVSAQASAYGPLQPPLPLPQTLRGTVHVPVAGDARAADAERVNTLRDLFPALASCWQPPEGLAKLERTEITTRFSLRRDGSVIGTPVITFSTVPTDTRARDVMTKATLDAIRRCTPARITDALGGAIAGRPLALRFIYDGPRGQGV